MKSFIVLIALFGCAIAGEFIPQNTLIRTPYYDSAIVRSDRIGGNFAYSTVEGHAYKQVAPVIQNVATPVALRYHANLPITYSPYAHPYAYSHNYYV